MKKPTVTLDMDFATFKEAYEYFGARTLYDALNAEMEQRFDWDRRLKRGQIWQRVFLGCLAVWPLISVCYFPIRAMRDSAASEHHAWLQHRIHNMDVCSAGQTAPCQRALDWEMGDAEGYGCGDDCQDRLLYVDQLKSAYRAATGRKIYSSSGQ